MKALNKLDRKVKILVLFLALAAFAFLYIAAQKDKTGEGPGSDREVPYLGGVGGDYSNIANLIPGSSDIEEVTLINGKPDRTVEKGGKTYLYYKTPAGDFENELVLSEGILQYASERWYSEKRGKLTDWTSYYDERPLILYQPTEESMIFHIFLNAENTYGLGLGVVDDTIFKVLYFVPQDKKSFMENVGKPLGLSEKPQSGPEEF